MGALTLHARQGELLRASRKARILLAPGPVRSGKTMGAVAAFAWWSLKYPEGLYIVVARTLTQVREAVIPAFKIAMSHLGMKVNEFPGKQMLTVGKRKYLMYDAQNEQSRMKIQGLTLNGAYLDEVALMPQSYYDEVLARCSMAGSKIFATCNPEGPHHWVKLKMVDNERVTTVPFAIEDNPDLSTAYLQNLKSSWSGATLKRKYYGEWAAQTGLVFPEWTAGNPPKRKKRGSFVSVDYASSTHTHALRFVEYDSGVWITDEWRSDPHTADDVQIAVIRKRWADLPMVIDPSAAAFRLLARDQGVLAWAADNRVLEGIQATNHLLSSKRVRISRRCRHLITELHQYRWDEKAQERGEDKPLKQNDHAVDALRYGCMALATPRKGRVRIDYTH